MQLTERTFLIGSGELGFSLSDGLDCHVYLIDCGAGCVLVDAGAGRDVDMLISNAGRYGYAPEQIQAILLTHDHADHIGGCEPVFQRTGCRIYASVNCAQTVMKADERANYLDHARQIGMYPKDYRLRACPVHSTFTPGDRLLFGDCQFEVLHTPGHAKHHYSFLVTTPNRRDLFGGDILFAGGRILLQGRPDCSIADYTETIKQLAAIEYDGLFPGHGAILIHRGTSAAQQAKFRFDRLELPPNLI